MTKEAMEGALKAINEEARKLLPEEFIEKISKGLKLIMSISLYESDVRGTVKSN